MRGDGSRCMFHSFDRETHRCTRCTRWQAGFAPKKANAKPRAECQVCEGVQAIDRGYLWHHGYARPGWGHIVGDCRGVGRLPFPATDALVEWLAMVLSETKLTTKALEELPTRETITVKTRNRQTRAVETITLKRGEVRNPWEHPSSFNQAIANRTHELESSLRRLASEKVRVEARIVKGNELTRQASGTQGS